MRARELFPRYRSVKKTSVIQLPHSKSEQKPKTDPGMNVSGFYAFATITVNKNTKQSMQNGTGINLFDSLLIFAATSFSAEFNYWTSQLVPSEDFSYPLGHSVTHLSIYFSNLFGQDSKHWELYFK